MITRINLIEKEPFRFSYKKLVVAVIGVLVFCLVLFGFQLLRLKMSHNKVERLSAEITRLKKERERLLKTAHPQIKGGSSFELKKVFDRAIDWSKLLTDISRRLPGSVWLNSLKTKTPEGAATKTELELRGKARRVSDLPLFVGRLKKSPHISKAALKSSKKDSVGFTFKIDCDIIPANR